MSAVSRLETTTSTSTDYALSYPLRQCATHTMHTSWSGLLHSHKTKRRRRRFCLGNLHALTCARRLAVGIRGSSGWIGSAKVLINKHISRAHHGWCGCIRSIDTFMPLVCAWVLFVFVLLVVSNAERYEVVTQQQTIGLLVISCCR